MTEAAKIRVILVDDSAIVRGLMQRALKEDPQIEIVATATDGAMAIDVLKANPTDLMILDIEMPVMDGLTALPKLLAVQPGVKIIIASTLSLRNAEISMKAMGLGAMDYLAKPSATTPGEVQEFYRQLIGKIKALAAGATPVAAGPAPTSAPAPRPTATPVFAAAKIATAPPIVSPALAAATGGLTPLVPVTTVSEAVLNLPRFQAVAIASSTGGPQALLSLFGGLKGKTLPVPLFITQHMPPNFTTILADHISKACGGDCHEAKEGELVKTGSIYVAPGDYHMVAQRSGVNPTLHLTQTPPENFCRPSADPMLRSLAAIYGKHLLTIVLTGMGSDGSPGAAEVVRHGGTVVAQSEASCVVYGMPKAVTEAKLVRAILPLNEMAPFLLRALGV